MLRRKKDRETHRPTNRHTHTHTHARVYTYTDGPVGLVNVVGTGPRPNRSLMVMMLMTVT